MASDQLRVINVLDKALRGWLPVVDDEGENFEICYGTAVNHTENINKYTITEGFHKNKTVRIDYNKIIPQFFNEYVGNIDINANKCFVVVDLSSNKLIYSDAYGLHELNVQANNLSVGDYSIICPDRRHDNKISKEYLSEYGIGTRFAETWFPIIKEKFEFRYLHFGSYSNGCVTVIGNGQQWTALYKYVITSRLGEMTHGHLIVVDKIKNVPELIR
ncbi:hypothetical protein KJZ67_00025 [Patescibacteria group bacterium]|nr:hypothetical protein [Patescibacteria group bacterium]